MKKRQESILVLAIAAVFIAAMFLPGLIRAGELDPPDQPITGTMKTLDEIYDKLEVIDDKLDGGSCQGAPVEKTGQTTSYATGDDGDLEKGVAWPVPRFTDNEDGTVKDNLTGLIWLKNANCFGLRAWSDALSDCNGLASESCGLTDGSVAGDWRLPNLKELLSMIHWGVYNPVVSDTSGTGQWSADDPFTGVQSYFYWSSTTLVNSTSQAWNVDMNYGYVNPNPKGGNRHVWPVRGSN